MKLSKSNFYTFEVGKVLNKIELAKLIEDKFKVDVVSVRTINIKGKTKAQKTRRGTFSIAPSRKVIVKLKPGQRIAYFETPTEDDGGEEVVVTKAEETKETKEKKSLLKGTKVKIEKTSSPKKTKENKKDK